MPRIRLYLDHPLSAGQSVVLSRDHAHYLFGVMRRKSGDEVLVFNGSDGEWRALVERAGKRDGRLRAEEQTRAQVNSPDLWLIFAPIKKARTDFIVEKAVELGASRIVPVQTEFTNAERIRRDRLQAHAVEAAEQCGCTFVPDVAELAPMSRLLDTWDNARNLIFCDECLAGEGDATLPPAPAAILVGPEGGFSDAERTRLAAMSATTKIGLGPRILRADTAAVAALTLWQSNCGDWRG